MCQLANVTTDPFEPPVDTAIGLLAFSTVESAARTLGVTPSRLLQALLGEPD